MLFTRVPQLAMHLPFRIYSGNRYNISSGNRHNTDAYSSISRSGSMLKATKCCSTSMSTLRSSPYDVLTKVLILGCGGVGKSCVLRRFCHGTYSPNYAATVGVEFHPRIIEINGKAVKLQTWVTCGQDRFRSVISHCYRHTDVIILMFDLVRRDSFTSINEWFTEVQEKAPSNVSMLLVGNKVDLNNQRSVSSQEGSNLAAKLGIPYVEVSAKTGDGVEKAFEIVGKQGISRSECGPNHESDRQSQENLRQTGIIVTDCEYEESYPERNRRFRCKCGTF